jgi:hypothetical protein
MATDSCDACVVGWGVGGLGPDVSDESPGSIITVPVLFLYPGLRFLLSIAILVL